ncbi:MAG: CHASE2 domain-containing protein [Gammaproteobacteria bacterium]|nr:CHASE2 domain-containing protein [Gammaproteobacteria bacterium]
MTTSTAYSARAESIKLGLLLGCLCLAIIYGDWTWRWDRLIYDAQSSLIRQQASDDIVIIAIDEKSLTSIGRWPWPRSIHAELINKLTEYQAKAILVDVIFAEPSFDKKNDELLAIAIKNNGTVNLPVLLEQNRLQGQLLETLPLPILTQANAKLGHVHIELDPDGIARGAYLYEGLGEAHWPHIGLSVLSMLNEVPEELLNIKNENTTTDTSPWTWVRKNHFLIPYIGPIGSFKTTSYINVLNNHVSADSFKDKIVLIGVTAAGLGDSLPTPVSGLTRAMPGIEINANIIQAIKSNSLIKTITDELLYIIAVALVMLPIFIFPYLSPRLTLIFVIGEITLLLFCSLLLLHVFHIWIPLSATLISLLLSYPLWAWRRLEYTVKYLNYELETLSKEAHELERYVAQNTDQSFESLQSLIPITSLSIYSKTNELIFKQGDSCSTKNSLPLYENKWAHISANIYATRLLIEKNTHKAYISWNLNTPPNESQSKIIKTYIRQQVKPKIQHANTTVEIIESRIHDIQTTTDKLANLRHFITDSLEQMADGVIVIDSLGIITLANHQAIKQISGHDGAPLLHQPIQPVLERLILTTGESWSAIISELLSKKHYENLQVRTHKNKDLVVNISPLYNATATVIGFIINLSDITEIKDAQRRRNEMLSFLSHDLRSPLVSVLAIIEKNKSNHPDTSLNNRIEKNINQTIQLAEDFVHLARVESNEDIKFNTVNMSDIIANAVDTVWDQAKLKNIQLIQNTTDSEWIHGNGSILERVLVNLLTNAIKYSHKECTVTVKLTKNESVITCCVEDNGPGINKEDLTSLFDRFQRAHQQSRKQSSSTLGIEPGLGLGLAFVHAAITKHNGSVTVDSELGKGSRFCIQLPEDLDAH